MTTTDTAAIQPATITPPPQTSMSPLELDGYLTGVIVTPQAAPIRPSAWMARLWGDDEPIFEDEEQINAVLAAVALRYNMLLRDIDRSLKRMETDRIIDYRPMFLTRDQKPTHAAVREWVRGFWKAIELAPETWSELVHDKRTKVVLQPFSGFFDFAGHALHEITDVDDMLDDDAALIPRMILLLRKLVRIRQTTSSPPPLPRRAKIGRNDRCPCGSAEKFKRCCGRA
jgi:uncharacterized protein